MFNWEKMPVYFNGYDLSPYLNVINLDRGIGGSRSNNLLKSGNQKGKTFSSYTYDEKTISMKFSLVQDLNSKRRELAKILNVDSPKPLVFGDEPDKYYLALPSGNISLDEVAISGSGTMEWIVPYGVALSRDEYLFTNRDNSSQLLSDTITINNPGSEKMDLELSASFKSDNGFLGLEDSSGKIRSLFGNIEEIDGFNYEVSEKLFDDHLNVTRGWTLNNGVVPPVTGSVIQQGTFGYKQESTNEGYAYPTSYGTPSASWTGPSLTKNIQADSNGDYPENWTSAFRVDFNTDGGGKTAPNQVGHQSLTFSDQNGKIIVSIVIEDNTPTGRKSDLVVYIRNKRAYDSRNTSSYYVTARPNDANHIKIEKIGKKINVELAFIGRKLTFDFPETGIFLRKVTFYTARYKSLLPMQNNLLRAINVVKHNISKYEDIPNKFMNGDKLVYGKSERNIYCRLNEMNALEMRDVGSTLISAPPGNSTIYLAYSSFSNTPEIILKGSAKYT